MPNQPPLQLSTTSLNVKRKILQQKSKDQVFFRQHLQTVQTSYSLYIDLGPAQG